MLKELLLENASLEIWGIVLRQPTIALTDLLLALECWILSRRLEPGGALAWIPVQREEATRPPLEEPQSWSGFFFFIGIATLLGAVEHGIPHYLAGTPLSLTIFFSSLAAGLGILHAEVAAIRNFVQGPSPRRWLRRGALGKFAVFGAALALGAPFRAVILNTALGLAPVMIVECAALHRGHRNSAWVAAGLGFAAVTASAYLLTTSSHPWIDHRTLAHLLMMATLLMIYLGVRYPLGSPSASRQALEQT